MKKYIVILIALLFSGTCFAQEDVENFFSDLIEDGAPASVKKEESGFTARKVFQMAPKKEIIPEIEAPKINYTENVVVKKSGIEREVAPFGLYWGLSLRETEENGVYLRPYTKNNDVYAYEATSLPKPIKEFSVIVDFGDSDELWKITAFSTPEKDDDGATKAVALYKKFYNLLEKKYGPGQEDSFAPEDMLEGESGYLEALISGDAKLASSFGDTNVNAKIEVKALPDKETFVILEYVSTKITHAREEDILDAL